MKKKIKQLAPSDDQILINIGDQHAELIHMNAITSSNEHNTVNWSQKDGTINNDSFAKISFSGQS